MKVLTLCFVALVLTSRMCAAALPDGYVGRPPDADQKSATCWANIGSDCAKVGRWPEAISAYDHSLSIVPNAPGVVALRAHAWQASGQPWQAFLDFRYGARLAPRNVQMYAGMAETLASLKRYPEALVQYDAAVKLAPRDAFLYIERSDIYRTMGKPVEALADATRAVHLAPLEASAWHTRGVLWSEAGQLKNSVHDLKKAVALAPAGAARTTLEKNRQAEVATRTNSHLLQAAR